MTIAFHPPYAALGERFFAAATPTPVRAPALVALNEGLAAELGLDVDWLRSDAGIAMLAGNDLPPSAQPVALAYAGHQFGGFVPQLGDGRAHLLGQVTTPDGQRFDVQLKGSGRTRFSRGGDGRAWIGPVLREYLVAEAMFALGVPTTRALAAVTTGEPVFRETPRPGAIITRVARTHVRVGTFEYFAARRDVDAVRALADAVIAGLFPEAADDEKPYLALLRAVMRGQAELVAHWMAVGFIHGVMNTDNTQVAGETIDYGPCAFMDAYDPATVFSSIDRQGRYAYGNQPFISKWNLSNLAECLLPLIDDVDAVQAALDAYAPMFNDAFLARMRRKIGLSTAHDDDAGLLGDLLDRMTAEKADFTNTFRALARAAEGDEEEAAALLDDGDWLARWRARCASEPEVSAAARAEDMRRVNPAFIPRNHRVEAALDAAEDGDYGPFARLLEVLARPYDDQPAHDDLRTPPAPGEEVKATFCGT